MRHGQTIFNFLEWLHREKGIDNSQSFRMADPFALSDEQWEAYFKEWREKFSE